MKKLFNQGNRLLFALFLGYCLFFSQRARSGEFAIINGTYYYSSSANAFTCHVSPPYPGNVPTNWLSPNDYWNGTFYAYYEVIDIPTNQPFAMQMGIFQYYPNAQNWDGHSYYETCSLIIPTLQGAGDQIEVNYGSPKGWWQHDVTGGVDFSRVYDFESVGPVMYSRTPGAYGILYPPDAAAWAVRANYFPCTIRVIVVAVSAGSIFSGWDNYISGGGCNPPAQPGTISGSASPAQGSSQTYSISEVSGATSYSWTLPSGWTGNSTTSSITATVGSSGGTISVTANNSCGSSTARTLSVSVGGGCSTPDQPGAISGNTGPTQGSSQTYSISEVSGAISYTWTLPSGWTGSSTSSSINVTVGINGGTISVKANNACGSSTARTLSVSVGCDNPVPKPTPTYSIDYGFELTNKVIPSTDEYAYNSNMSGAVSGNGQKIYVIPGQDVYFRAKASGDGCYTASAVQPLDVPTRPATPTFSVDCISETTVENVGTNIWYSTSNSYMNPIAATGEKLALTPGQDLYLWVKPTASSFASMNYHLDVPARPSAPAVTLDYANEKTSSIPSTQEWSTSSSMTSLTAGTNAPVNVTPGTDLYIRTKATASAFASSIQSLDVPNRPGGPVYAIDFANEKTASAVLATVEYSTHSDMSSASSGTSTAIAVTPGTDLYFRTKATGSAFRSTISSLDVPIRPSLVYTGPSTVTEPTITMNADLDASMTGFDLTDLSVTNGTAQNLRANNTFDVIGAEKGDVKVIIPCNKFDGTSFASNEVVVYYDKASTGLPDYKDEKFILYPNPADNGNIYLKSAGIKASRIDVLSSNGVCLRSLQINKDNAQQISLQDLPKGIYILQIFSDEGTCLQKIIIE